jgi:hypothetical protein
MNRDKSSQEKQYRESHLRDIEDTYSFDADSGIYKPKGYESEKEKKRKARGAGPSTPFFINSGSDGCMVLFAAFSSIVAFFTLVIVGFYTYYAHGQWEQMIKAADAAKKSADQTERSVSNAALNFRIDERAWVGISHFVIDKHADDWSNLNYTATFQNSGKTPAVKLSVRGDFLVVGFWDLPYPPPYRKLEKLAMSHGEVGPGTTGTIPGYIVAKDPSESAEIAALHKFYYVYGTIKYSDIFGGQHWTHYCYRVPAAGYPASLCEYYNDTDADEAIKK